MTRGLKRELWQERICNYRSSGLNAQAWCQQNKFTLSSLHYWINKLNKESLESDSTIKHEFVPITQMGISMSPSMSPSAPIVIRYQNLSIEVSESCQPNTLRNVLEILNIYA